MPPTVSSEPLTFAILGAGGRGAGFGYWVRDHPEFGKVVAIAEPDEARRKPLVDSCGIVPERVFNKWEDLLAKPKMADVVINTTMDQLHAPSAIEAMKRGYHMLLEKPMATTLDECVAIDAARRKHKRMVAVCHSLRYLLVLREAKRMLDDGVIGRIVTLDALEGVEAQHQSHSFVRGNWGNEDRSTFMLMSKSCHDMDMIAWLIGRPCKRVSSFGALTYFRKEHAPPGATKRCTDGCPAEPTCHYSAIRLYVHASTWMAGQAGLPADRAARVEALKTNRYGQCAFQCDNDVVDHQVVAFEFEGAVTATFTMTAFHPGGRFIRVHGTHGFMSIALDTNTIEVTRFLDKKHDKIVIPPQAGGHGGGDDRVMRQLVQAIRTGDASHISTPTDVSLATHKITFAAELARREGRVVELSELDELDGFEMPAWNSRDPAAV